MVIKKYFLILIALLLTSSAVFAQSIKVKVSTDSLEYKVGDYINYTLEIERDKNIKVTMPSVQDSITVLDFIKEKPVVKEEEDSKVIEKHTYIFSKYDSAGVTIPSFSIFYTVGKDPQPKIIKTDSLSIVVSTLEVNLQKEIQDVKAPIKIPMNWWFIIILALIIIVLAAAGYFGYRYYQKKKSGQIITKKIIILPPHKIALKELFELEEKKLWQQGKIKEYHSDVTGIIRKYFEGRFKIAALEMPSSELLDQMRSVPEAGIIHDKTRDFLNNADMVKFARFQPMPSVNEEMMKQAYEIVNTTKPAEAAEQFAEVVDAK
ncbi:MAG: hypothetical protein V1720_10710 [bacterium]